MQRPVLDEFIESYLNQSYEKWERISAGVNLLGMSYLDLSYYESLINNPLPELGSYLAEVSWTSILSIRYMVMGVEQLKLGKTEQGILNLTTGIIFLFAMSLPPPLFVLSAAMDLYNAWENYKSAPEDKKNEKLHLLIPKIVSCVAWTIYAIPTFLSLYATAATVASAAAICAPLGLALATGASLYYGYQCLFKPLCNKPNTPPSSVNIVAPAPAPV